MKKKKTVFDCMTKQQIANIYNITLELMAQQLLSAYEENSDEYEDKIVEKHHAVTSEQIKVAYIIEAMKIYNGEDSVIE